MFEYNISLYAMHTNLDVGLGGVNDVLAKKIFLNEYQIINGEVGKGNFLRYGNVKKQTVKEYALMIKESLNLTGVRVIGNLDKEISRVGIVGGSGAHPSDIVNAFSVGCDCYVTGEVKLNIAQDAIVNNLSIIEVNHGVEKEVFYSLKRELDEKLALKGDIFVSEIETDPMTVIG